MNIPQIYDDLADHYDARYTSPQHRAEDRQIARWLDSPHLANDHVLDIGCGTGHAIDLLDAVKPEQYTGIDPSTRMLDRAAAKYPAYADQFVYASFESAAPLLTPHRLIIALYGAASYLTPHAIDMIPQLLASRGRAFLMCYRPGYLPSYDRGIPGITQHVPTAHYAATNLPGARTTDWHDFTIITL